MTQDLNGEDTTGSQPSRSRPDIHQFEIQYFIQTRREIDTEKQERNKLLNYALLATGAFAFALAQVEGSTDFLTSSWALGLYLPLLLLISGIVAARRMKLSQIFDRWKTLYSMLQSSQFGQDWTPLEETVTKEIEGPRYLFEDFALHLGLSAMVYGLMIITMFRLISNGQGHWPLLVIAFVVLHLVLTTQWLLRGFSSPSWIGVVLSRCLVCLKRFPPG